MSHQARRRGAGMAVCPKVMGGSSTGHAARRADLLQDVGDQPPMPVGHLLLIDRVIRGELGRGGSRHGDSLLLAMLLAGLDLTKLSAHNIGHGGPLALHPTLLVAHLERAEKGPIRGEQLLKQLRLLILLAAAAARLANGAVAALDGLWAAKDSNKDREREGQRDRVREG